MKCPVCGSELAEGAKFCVRCGAHINDPAATQVAPVANPAPAAVPYQATQQAPATAAASGESAPSDDEDARARANANLASAKAAYKQARKDAGKSAAPKVIGGAVALILALGLGAGGMYAFMNSQSEDASTALSASKDKEKKLKSQITELQKELDEAQAETDDQAEDEGTADDADSSSDSTYDVAESEDSTERFVGTYTGSSTEGATGRYNKKCFGSEGKPLKLTINEIGESGRMSINLSVLFHGHDGNYKNDQTSVTGDKYLSFENVTSSFDKGSSSFSVTIDGVDSNDEDAELELRFTQHQTDSSVPSFDVQVRSETSSGTLTENYVIEKK